MNQNQPRVNLQPYFSISNLREPLNLFRVKNMQRWVNCLLLSSLTIFFLCIQACNAPKQTATSTPAVDISTIEKPRNVIFLIGDGMGLPQITGAMYMNGNKTVF